MTTIVELPSKFNTIVKKIIDRREEFKAQISKSQFITYTLDYFTDCFMDTPPLLKSIHIRLIHLKSNHRPIINQYLISWEDITQNEDETWKVFKQRVNKELREFLEDLKSNSNVIEGPIF